MPAILAATACASADRATAVNIAPEICEGVRHVTMLPSTEIWIRTQLDAHRQPVRVESFNDADLTDRYLTVESAWDTAGNLLEVVSYDQDDEIWRDETWTWKHGQVERFERRDGNGNIEQERRSVFAADGTEAEMTFHQDGRAKYTEVYTYDYGNRLLSFVRWRAFDGAVEATLDNDWLEPAPGLDRTETLDFGINVFEDLFLHDENGRVATHKQRHDDNFNDTIYAWTPSGEPASEHTISQDTKWRREWTYDDRGLVETERFDQDEHQDGTLDHGSVSTWQWTCSVH